MNTIVIGEPKILYCKRRSVKKNISWWEIPKEEYIGKEIPIQDKELEKEIERTEAAVDDCIRRREMRARVSVARPVGKHMSEEERDLVCEKIGDEPGARAKRRREIKEMS